MALVWSEERKLEAWLQVEIAVCETLAEQGVISAAELDQIKTRAAATPEAVREREQVTDHDVAAFVDVVSAAIGEAGRWVHYGLTSSDVLDTALALQIREAGRELITGADALTKALVGRAREFEGTLCMGRTHGVHAEPTTFGLKLAGFAFESRRNADRLRDAFTGAEVG
jgi:adenylosuccinate lyase